MKAIRTSVHWMDRGLMYDLQNRFSDRLEVTDVERTNEIVFVAVGEDLDIATLAQEMSRLTTKWKIGDCKIGRLKPGKAFSMTDRGNFILAQTEHIK